MFAYRLALHLGRLDVDAMLAEIPPRKWREWLDYASLEPFGEERADMRAALVARTVAEVNRDAKKRPNPYSLSDFMLFRSRKRAARPTQTWRQKFNIMEKIARTFGKGRDITPDNPPPPIMTRDEYFAKHPGDRP